MLINDCILNNFAYHFPVIAVFLFFNEIVLCLVWGLKSFLCSISGCLINILFGITQVMLMRNVRGIIP